MLQLNVDQELIPGQPYTLRCSALHVYPIEELNLRWYRENKLLTDVFEETETDEGLFDVTTTVWVPGEDVVEGVVFRCELTLRIGSKTFTRVAPVPVSSRGEYRGWSWKAGFLQCSHCQSPPPLSGIA